MATAVSASISTPVRPVVLAMASMSIVRFAEFEVDVHPGQRQRVAERDELGGPLGAGDAGDARGGEHIGLRQAVGAHERDHLGGGLNPAARDRDACRLRLAADVDHARAAVGVEVRERLTGVVTVHSIHTVTFCPGFEARRVARGCRSARRPAPSRRRGASSARRPARRSRRRRRCRAGTAVLPATDSTAAARTPRFPRFAEGRPAARAGPARGRPRTRPACSPGCRGSTRSARRRRRGRLRSARLHRDGADGGAERFEHLADDLERPLRDAAGGDDEIGCAATTSSRMRRKVAGSSSLLAATETTAPASATAAARAIRFASKIWPSCEFFVAATSSAPVVMTPTRSVAAHLHLADPGRGESGEVPRREPGAGRRSAGRRASGRCRARGRTRRPPARARW